jgi:hypothetical protein
MVAGGEVTAIASGDRNITCSDCHRAAGRHLFDDSHHIVGPFAPQTRQLDRRSAFATPTRFA